jgi:hypothetical protein
MIGNIKLILANVSIQFINRQPLDVYQRMSQDREFDGCQFDIDVSDPFLKTFSLINIELKNR